MVMVMVWPRRIPAVLVLGPYRRILLGSGSSTPLCLWHMPSLLYSYRSTFYVGVDLPSYCATPDCFADSVVLYRTMDTSIQPAQYHSLLFHLNSSTPKAHASDVYRVYRVLNIVLCWYLRLYFKTWRASCIRFVFRVSAFIVHALCILCAQCPDLRPCHVDIPAKLQGL